MFPSGYFAKLASVVNAGFGVARRIQKMRYKKYIQAIVPEHLRKFTSVEVVSDRNLTLAHEGTSFVKFWLYPGQRTVHKGIRSEIGINYPFVEGETIRYEWLARLYDGATTATILDKQMTVAQWHDQPDPAKGETWKNFPARQAPIHLLCHADGTSLNICLRYGTPGPLDGGATSVPIKEWIRFVAMVRWSTGNEGRFSLRIGDGQVPKLEAKGPNMHNAFHTIFKVGNYRHREFDIVSCVDIGRMQVQQCPGYAWEGV